MKTLLLIILSYGCFTVDIAAQRRTTHSHEDSLVFQKNYDALRNVLSAQNKFYTAVPNDSVLKYCQCSIDIDEHGKKVISFDVYYDEGFQFSFIVEEGGVMFPFLQKRKYSKEQKETSLECYQALTIWSEQHR